MPALLYCPGKKYLFSAPRGLAPTASVLRVWLFRVSLIRNPLRRLGAGMGIVSRLFRGIFGLAPRILDFAFGLFRGTLHLRFGTVRPFPRLAFNASGDVLHFPFNTVLIHFALL